jgi:hypothetical protein
MASDKLSICQDALTLTGNNVPPIADDGSEEWKVASVAYESAIDSLIEAHNWNFATVVVALQRAGDSPDDMFTDAYTRPQDCLAVVWIRTNDVPTDYKIIGQSICLNAYQGVVTTKYVRQPDAGSWPPMFVDCIRQLTMAGIYRGLNEDLSAANAMEQRAMQSLADARTRTDQEQPKRALFNSRLRTTRNVRRPWINDPPEWGGTGNPSGFQGTGKTTG